MLPSVRGSEAIFNRSSFRPFSAAGTLCGIWEGSTLLFTAFDFCMGAIITFFSRNVNTLFQGIDPDGEGEAALPGMTDREELPRESRRKGHFQAFYTNRIKCDRFSIICPLFSRYLRLSLDPRGFFLYDM